MFEFIMLATGLTLGAAVVVLLRVALRKAPAQPARFDGAIDRVRQVGRLVTLEVQAKEIATSTKGLNWLPPVILSKARVAMIFRFEKQYAVDLARLDRSAIVRRPDGSAIVHMPPVESRLRLIEMTPYDIAAGRVLGLLDVIQVNAEAQKQLTEEAQAEAARLFDAEDARYRADAQRAAEDRIRDLLACFDIDAEFVWAAEQAAPAPRVEVASAIKQALTTDAA